MPAVARKNSTDTVASPDGTGDECGYPTTQSTAEGSGDVFCNNIGVVRAGDKMITHPHPPNCTPHAPALSSFSPNVFANNKKVGRIGDVYGGDHPISSGSANVFANS